MLVLQLTNKYYKYDCIIFLFKNNNDEEFYFLMHNTSRLLKSFRKLHVSKSGNSINLYQYHSTNTQNIVLTLLTITVYICLWHFSKYVYNYIYILISALLVSKDIIATCNYAYVVMACLNKQLKLDNSTWNS